MPAPVPWFSCAPNVPDLFPLVFWFAPLWDFWISSPFVFNLPAPLCLASGPFCSNCDMTLALRVMSMHPELKHQTDPRLTLKDICFVFAQQGLCYHNRISNSRFLLHIMRPKFSDIFSRLMLRLINIKHKCLAVTPWGHLGQWHDNKTGKVIPHLWRSKKFSKLSSAR